MEFGLLIGAVGTLAFAVGYRLWEGNSHRRYLEQRYRLAMLAALEDPGGYGEREWWQNGL